MYPVRWPIKTRISLHAGYQSLCCALAVILITLITRVAVILVTLITRGRAAVIRAGIEHINTPNGRLDTAPW